MDDNNPLAALSDQLADAVSRASGSTAAIVHDGTFIASGVIWKPGIIVTTDHALKKGNGKLEVIPPDGERVRASVKGRVSGVDIAVLEVDLQTALAHVRVDAGKVRTGQLMLVTGRSLDTGVNATMGVVSAVSGPWRTWKGGQMDRFIRLDVALFPGVNGGLVLNSHGLAVGVATNALSRIAGVVIPSETVDAAVKRVLDGHAGSNPGYLGVGLHEVEYNGRKVPIVLSVMQGGAAERGGIIVGDLLTSMGGRELTGVRDVWTELLEPASAGREVEIGLIRGGQPLTLHVTIGERPATSGEGEE